MREIVSLANDRAISIEEAQLRLGWQLHVPKLAERAEKELGRSFGGVWVDIHDGDRVKLATVRGAHTDVALRAAQFAADAGIADATDILEVQYALEDLQAANQWLSDLIVKLGPDNTLSVGLRTDINAVELQFPRDGKLSDREQSVVDLAVEQLGDLLIVGSYEGPASIDACAYPYCDPSLRGGIRITRGLLGAGCTGAFVAQSKIDSKLYMFTAGHCVEGFTGTTWWTKFTNNSDHAIGATHNFIHGTAGDMAILNINNVPGWDPENWVHVTAGPDTTTNTSYTITAEGSSSIGMRICITGASLGNSDCGDVTQLGVTHTAGGATVTNLGRADYCRTAGDSGAPLYASHKAYGLHRGAFGACDAVYTSINTAENLMNVNVLH